MHGRMGLRLGHRYCNAHDAKLDRGQGSGLAQATRRNQFDHCGENVRQLELGAIGGLLSCAAPGACTPTAGRHAFSTLCRINLLRRSSIFFGSATTHILEKG